LFIGEAPGTSENDTGQPFTGPAGQLLDLIIARALMKKKVSIAFTNLVACIPLDEEGKKTLEPSEEAIEACSMRLDELVSLASPKGLVFVGKLAKAHLERYKATPSVMITHPAAILRTERKEQKPLMVQNCVVDIADLISELGL
jgi:DNA polymerase